jgi:hypothetical protein
MGAVRGSLYDKARMPFTRELWLCTAVITMADTSVRILFCLLDGESAFFQVKAYTNDIVLNLKRRIHKEKSVVLGGVADANELILLKASSFIIDAPSLNAFYS